MVWRKGRATALSSQEQQGALSHTTEPHSIFMGGSTFCFLPMEVTMNENALFHDASVEVNSRFRCRRLERTQAVEQKAPVAHKSHTFSCVGDGL